MEDSKSFMPDELFLDKDFDMLSASEKEIVRAGIGEAEYRRLREVVTNSTAILKSEASGLEPDPQLKNKLVRGFQQLSSTVQPARTPWFMKALNFRIPMYQAMLAASVLILLTFILQQNYFIPSPPKCYIPVVQTIHVHENRLSPFPSASTSKTLYIREPSVPPTPVMEQSQPDRKDEEIPELFAAHIRATDQLLRKVTVSSVGNNALHDSLLFQLLVTVN